MMINHTFKWAANLIYAGFKMYTAIEEDQAPYIVQLMEKQNILSDSNDL